MGHIVDVIVDRAGTVRAAVIDFGGFLGVGSRKIVVDWSALHFGHVADKGDSITLELTKEQVTAAPEYKEDQADRGARRSGQPAAAAIRSLSEAEQDAAHVFLSLDLNRIDERPRAVRTDRQRCGSSPGIGTGAWTRRPAPSRQSQRGLDWFIFFLADVQTGFGPFIAVYLTTQKWTQGRDRLGAVDRRHRRADRPDAGRRHRRCSPLGAAGGGPCGCDHRLQRAGLCGVADLSRWWSTAATLHAAASCVLGPAIAAISLGLVGPPAIGERLGRNARFASLGNGVGRGRDGHRPAICCPAVRCSWSPSCWRFRPCWRLSRIRERGDRRGPRARRGVAARRPMHAASDQHRSVWCVSARLLIFAGAVLLLQLANAAMLPLMAGVVTTRSSQWAPVLIAACIIVPQAIVALMSPIGRAQGAAMGAAAAAADRLRARWRFAACCLRSCAIRICWSPCRSSTASPRRSSA